MTAGAAWIVVGALGCALAVAAGAFGAHGLAGRLSAESLALWETASRYLMAGALGVLVAGSLAHLAPAAGFQRGAACLAVGAVVFSGTVAALALGAPRWLGAVTPLGGLLLIAGFALLAWGAVRM